MKCNNCGFANEENASDCINCGTRFSSKNPFQILQQNDQSFYNCKQCGYLLPDTVKVCSKCQFDHDGTKKSNTIHFTDFDYKAGGNSTGFTLTPLKPSDRPIVKTGEEIGLNREDIDVNDMTISSNDHVKFKQVNGSWFIENAEGKNAVFIQVDGSVPIKDGTIIILGQSKIYKFEAT